MLQFRCTAALVVSLAASALVVSACAGDGATAPVMDGALASKGSGGGGGGGGGGDGGGGGGGGVVAPPTVLTRPVYLSESFGVDPFHNGTPTRFDAAGRAVSAFTGKSIDGIRAEVPNIASEVWISPDVSHSAVWAFAVSSASSDPLGPFESPNSNGVLASNNNPTNVSNNAALLPFLQPSGAVTASVTANAGPYSTAVGFTTAATPLTGTFESVGAAWLVFRLPAEEFVSGHGVATWDLHTNGLMGPSATGTMQLAVIPGTTVLVQQTHRIAVTFDPARGTVSGSIDGVAAGSVPYTVTGVTYAGIQGYGIVNDFRVEAASSSAP